MTPCVAWHMAAGCPGISDSTDGNRSRFTGHWSHCQKMGTQMDDESSISIVLTPVQLAAILQGDSISSESTVSNRFWGSLRLVGGIAEMIGGAALCAVPEPTGATKVGCVVLGGHGIDTASTGLQEIWTGQEIRSLTERGLIELATRLGAEPGSGKALGMSVELAVPIGFASAIKAANKGCASDERCCRPAFTIPARGLRVWRARRSHNCPTRWKIDGVFGSKVGGKSLSSKDLNLSFGSRCGSGNKYRAAP